MRTHIAIRREIKRRWREICKVAGTVPAATRALPQARNIRILGSGHKTEMGEAALGVFTAVVYMAPDDEAFPEGDTRTLCPMAGLCSNGCIGRNTGYLAMAPAKRSRLWKATLFLGDRELFAELIDCEIAAHERLAARLAMVPAVRFDGSTDTGYGAVLAQRFAGSATQFYDYTKVRARLRRSKKILNYDLTYSLSERSRGPLPAGFNVAAVFALRKGEPFPKTFMGREVISGDEHDVRFMDDKRERIVALSFKAARAREQHLAHAMGFVQSEAR